MPLGLVVASHPTASLFTPPKPPQQRRRHQGWADFQGTLALLGGLDSKGWARWARSPCSCVSAAACRRRCLSSVADLLFFSHHIATRHNGPLRPPWTGAAPWGPAFLLSCSAPGACKRLGCGGDACWSWDLVVCGAAGLGSMAMAALGRAKPISVRPPLPPSSGPPAHSCLAATVGACPLITPSHPLPFFFHLTTQPARRSPSSCLAPFLSPRTTCSATAWGEV